ncbi:hypothetical protein JY651_27745 [Pyxidicoccus parkwayensis]|uniref:Uncharacterized protein n=1 Tax=Pyxidicoccus parkwayensis TaxID=2813578 RepID=A0ABX7NJX0_9BACT|nr:hypothetical protein [Pyxidicoccus parkwaysis]QSQ19139.1 hypothetical protein JY651_27745 [Pyxidicoccus parkwaysis]
MLREELHTVVASADDGRPPEKAPGPPPPTPENMAAYETVHRMVEDSLVSAAARARCARLAHLSRLTYGHGPLGQQRREVAVSGWR